MDDQNDQSTAAQHNWGSLLDITMRKKMKATLNNTQNGLSLKEEGHHWTTSQGRGKGVRHTHRQGGWDSDFTRIMQPRVTNDRPGQ